MNQLSGRIVVVTGASGGLGTSICEVCGAQGATVVPVDIQGAGCLIADLATEEGNRLMIDTTLKRHGRIDALVLNAGVQHVAPIRDFDADAWDRLMGVLLRGPFLAMRHAWDALTERPGGRIVVTASTSAFLADPYKSAYVAAKHGVLGLVKVAAAEGGPHGLTANAVAPGLMLTPLIERQMADQVRLRGLTRDEVLSEFLAQQPIKRAVDTREVAEAIAFLASSASSGITGSCIPVDLGALAIA